MTSQVCEHLRVMTS